MNRHIVMTAAALLLFTMIASTTALAVDRRPGDRMGPPPEALEACKNKSEGTKVEVTTPRGKKISATCREIDGQLVAMPEDGFRRPKEPPGGRGPASE